MSRNYDSKYQIGYNLQSVPVHHSILSCTAVICSDSPYTTIVSGQGTDCLVGTVRGLL